MAKRRKKIGKVGSRYERLFYVGFGALTAKAVNAGLQNLTSNVTDESKLKWMKAGIGAGKALIGGYLTMQHDQMTADFGLGVVAAGALEAAEAIVPKAFAPIAGIDFVAGYGPDGSVYQPIAGTDYLPLRAGRTLLERPEETHGVYGPIGRGDLM